MITQAIPAMKPVRALVFTLERLFGTQENWNIRSEEFRRVQGIPRGLFYGNIASHRGDCQNGNIGRTKRHDQSYGIIRSSVRVNQEERFHAA
jgi:hypothetical protein